MGKRYLRSPAAPQQVLGRGWRTGRMDDGQVQRWRVEHSTSGAVPLRSSTQLCPTPNSPSSTVSSSDRQIRHRFYPQSACRSGHVPETLRAARPLSAPNGSSPPHTITHPHIPLFALLSSPLLSPLPLFTSTHPHPQCPPASPSTSRASPQRPPRPSFTTSSRYVLTPSLAPHQRHLTTEPQFCGKLQSVKKHGTEADITFEKQSAMRTALMLNGGTVS